MDNLKESSCKNIKFCFWDKHHFEGKGVMCPLYYKPKQIVRKKKEYYMNQNINRNSVINQNTNFQIFKIINEEIFYDDMFCSNECCLAWIEDNHLNPKYKNSKQILFNEILKEKKEIPNKSNNWKIIDKFGGFLDIQEFRENKKTYNKVDFFYKDQILVEKYKEIINYVK